MSRIVIDQDLIKEASDMVKHLTQERETLRQENQVLQDVLTLVNEGQVDPLDVHEKVAEFLEDPEKLALVKIAGFSHSTSERLGTLSDSTETFSTSEGPEDLLQTRIAHILGTGF